MNLVRFLVLTLIGSLIWNAGLVTAGYVLRDNWENVEPIISIVQYRGDRPHRRRYRLVRLDQARAPGRMPPRRRPALEGSHPVGDDGRHFGILALEVVATVEPVVGHRSADRARPLLQLVG